MGYHTHRKRMKVGRRKWSGRNRLPVTNGDVESGEGIDIEESCPLCEEKGRQENTESPDCKTVLIGNIRRTFVIGLSTVS